jgi:hypothetical protein
MYPEIERRLHGRQLSHIIGFVEVLGRARIACIVLDISDGGALIELRESVHIPPAFGLYIGPSNAPIACRVEHARGYQVGVSFQPQDGIVGAAAKRSIRNAIALLG